MDSLNAHILQANIMHDRLHPKRNQFVYKLFYVVLPLSSLLEVKQNLLFSMNRYGLLSFWQKDHGDKKNTQSWLQNILAQSAITEVDQQAVRLITLPRVLGYVFNPVSFWLCPNKNGDTIAVICEVNNTFGETHIYVCAHADGRPITAQDELHSKKMFHVSPFLKRAGDYKFKFSVKDNFFAAFVDYYDEEGVKTLLTAVSGSLHRMTNKNLWQAFINYPLATFKVITLIHWQALKLFIKGVKYVPKPNQLLNTVTKTNIKIND